MALVGCSLLGHMLQARSMTDKARVAAAGAMNNVRTAIDSAKRIGFNGNTVSIVCYFCQYGFANCGTHQSCFQLCRLPCCLLSFIYCSKICVAFVRTLQGSNYGSDSRNQMYNRYQQYIGPPQSQRW